jgi:hypothetical protein
MMAEVYAIIKGYHYCRFILSPEAEGSWFLWNFGNHIEQSFSTHGALNKALKLSRHAYFFKGEILSLKTSSKIVFKITSS